MSFLRKDWETLSNTCLLRDNVSVEQEVQDANCVTCNGVQTSSGKNDIPAVDRDVSKHLEALTRRVYNILFNLFYQFLFILNSILFKNYFK